MLQRNRQGKYQSGAALLALMAILIVVVTSAFLASMSLNKQRITQSRTNAKVLNEAKEGLLAYALRQTPPGRMICPDVDGDGAADIAGSNCQRQRGFLPYRDLSLKNYRDAFGNTLWYAVDTDYIDSGAVTLNPSLGADLVVDNAGSYVALLLAPGVVINNQSRRASDDADSVDEYLEGENADGNTARYSSVNSDSNNDDLLGISNKEFWSVVEKRVLVTAGALLANYFNSANCGEFPWAATNAAPGHSVLANEFGYLPLGTTISYGGASGCAATLSAPAWLQAHWADVIRYAFCGPSGASCIAVSGDKNLNADALLLSSGPLIAGQTRPSNNLSDYLEGENMDMDMQFEYREARNFDDMFNDVVYVITP